MSDVGSDVDAGDDDFEEEDEGEEEEEQEDGVPSTETINVDLSLLTDISSYMDNTRERMTAQLPRIYPYSAVKPLIADSARHAAVTGGWNDYDSFDDKQRASLLDKAIMVLMGEEAQTEKKGKNAKTKGNDSAPRPGR